jgi:hypothetical protein
MRPLKALGGTTYIPDSPWIHPLYESQNNKPDLLFADGNIRIVLCLLDSTLAITVGIQLQHLIIQPTTLLLYFGLQNKRNGSQRIQPTFLSGVLIYDDEQGSFINCRL